MAQPCQLPLRVRARVEFRFFAGAGEVALAFEIFHDATITVRAECVGIWRHSAAEKLPYFLDQPRIEVYFRTFVDSCIEFIAWWVEGHDSQAARAFGGVRAVGFLVTAA